MAQNPYSSTPQPTTAYSGRWRYIPLRVLTILASIGLLMFCLLNFLTVAIDTAGGLMFETFNDLDAPPSSETESIMLIAMSLFAIGSLFIFIFNMVVICMFMYRANVNVRALGATAVENTPAWCGGYWFVPILNLFRPYKCMHEIHRASQNPSGTSWKDLPAHALLGTWIIGNIVSNFASRATQNGLMGDNVWVLNLVTTALLIVSAILLVVILRSVTAFQESHVNRVGISNG